ncbi:hypothetical protein DV736_g3108, partial [Chaetothyriales sp. CBS 134916]
MGFAMIKSRTDFNAALEKTENAKSLLVIEYELNIDEAEDVSIEYGVNAVPTFMLFKDGDMLPEDKITGAGDAQRKVREMIEKNLKT